MPFLSFFLGFFSKKMLRIGILKLEVVFFGRCGQTFCLMRTNQSADADEPKVWCGQNEAVFDTKRHKKTLLLKQ
jgi:hypothetical protein